MSNLPRQLTRNTLGEFLPNLRAVRAIEQMLKQVGELLPADVVTLNRLIEEATLEASSGSAKAQMAVDLILDAIQDAAINIGAVDGKANEALQVLSRVANALELLAAAPVSKDANLATEVRASASKPTPVDADEFPLADSDNAFLLRKFTWANLKATLATWIGGNLIAGSFTSLASSTTGKVATTLGVGNATPSASGAGVTFPAVQSASSDANTLDDYEEGTWTATLTASVTAPTTPVTVTGTYTKIGRLVTVTANFSGVNTTGASGNIQVTGLPFTSSAAALGSLTKFGLGTTPDAVFVGASASYLAVLETTTTNNTAMVAGTNKYLIFSITYPTT